MTHEMTRYYAERAAEYERVYLQPAWQGDLPLVRERVLETFPGRRVLEVACGTGYWTALLAQVARSVHGEDVNAETLALNTPEAELVRADVFEWEPAERFGLVFFSFWLSFCFSFCFSFSCPAAVGSEWSTRGLDTLIPSIEALSMNSFLFANTLPRQ